MPLRKDLIVDYPGIIPYGKQSVVVPGTKRPGQTGALLSAMSQKQPE
jgi:hypothetical protein